MAFPRLDLPWVTRTLRTCLGSSAEDQEGSVGSVPCTDHGQWSCFHLGCCCCPPCSFPLSPPQGPPSVPSGTGPRGTKLGVATCPSGHSFPWDAGGRAQMSSPGWWQGTNVQPRVVAGHKCPAQGGGRGQMSSPGWWQGTNAQPRVVAGDKCPAWDGGRAQMPSPGWWQGTNVQPRVVAGAQPCLLGATHVSWWARGGHGWPLSHSCRCHCPPARPGLGRGWELEAEIPTGWEYGNAAPHGMGIWECCSSGLRDRRSPRGVPLSITLWGVLALHKAGPPLSITLWSSPGCPPGPAMPVFACPRASPGIWQSGGRE
ncbi:uncharacterized protein LOC120324649 [Pipra filicauda]|uniref:Uncharacterized protein LOC120324649 n=1 Tax=Pipra filicauda TaxID=649802 RepID=A0A7R5L351_9PASS|nr:uncharacterized protein LOC120324649 [Pipra filicauda]